MALNTTVLNRAPLNTRAVRRVLATATFNGIATAISFSAEVRPGQLWKPQASASFSATGTRIQFATADWLGSAAVTGDGYRITFAEGQWSGSGLWSGAGVVARNASGAWQANSDWTSSGSIQVQGGASFTGTASFSRIEGFRAALASGDWRAGASLEAIARVLELFAAGADNTFVVPKQSRRFEVPASDRRFVAAGERAPIVVPPVVTDFVPAKQARQFVIPIQERRFEVAA